jgi:uncharacterized protein (DUF1697 family)
MALIVFLRGVNVGGHRTFRPSVLARKLSVYDVENVGAAGTFVVWKPGPRRKFHSELLKNIPFEAHAAFCKDLDLVRLTMDDPFGTAPSPPDVVRFVSILPKAICPEPPMPLALPANGKWFVRLIGCKGQFVFGEYRRHMKTIGFLGQIDKLFKGTATTRNWNTIKAVARIVQSRRGSAR